MAGLMLAALQVVSPGFDQIGPNPSITAAIRGLVLIGAATAWAPRAALRSTRR